MRATRSWATVGALACSASALVLGAASPAAAHGCRVSGATLVKGALRDVYSKTTLQAGQSLRRVTSYWVKSDGAVIQWFDNTVTVTQGSQIGMSCYGLAAGDPADLPALSVMHGAATANDQGKRPLALLTIPALVGPAPEQVGDHLRFVATEHHSDTKPPTTHVSVLKGTAWINVTPYTGPQPGTCRHVISATLIDGDNGGYARYHLA